jgi:hypothetical protein
MSSISVKSTIPVVVPGSAAGLVSSSGLPGNTTGSAIATGYVGETISATVNGVSITTSNQNVSTQTTISNALTLSAGVWLISYHCQIGGHISSNGNIGGNSATSVAMNIFLWNNTTSTNVAGANRGYVFQGPSGVFSYGNDISVPASYSGVQVLSSTNTFYLQYTNSTSATGGADANGVYTHGYCNGSGQSVFFATRIA